MKKYYIREMKSVPYNAGLITPEFKLFVQKEIWPLLTTLHKGYRLEEKQQLLVHIIHNLIGTGLTNKVVADSRDDHNKDARKRIPIWDAVVENKLAKVCKGSETSKCQTRYLATSHLLNIRKEWELELLEDLNLKRNTETAEPTAHALVVLTSGKIDWVTGNPLPDEEQKMPLSIKKRLELTCRRDENDYRKADPRDVQAGLDYFRAIENLINDINKENLNHTWIAYSYNSETDNKIARPVNTCLRQIHSGSLFRGTRLYSWGAFSGQALSKEERQTIQIDGEAAAEFDSHCHAIRLTYHYSGLDERGDIYYPEKVFASYYNFTNVSAKARKVVRDFVKTCTNIMLNTGSETIAKQAINQVLCEHDRRSFLEDLIIKIEGTNLDGILERIVKAHPKKVADKFFTEYGLIMMRNDSMIMFHTLTDFVAKHHRPALAIHDSMVVRVSDVKRAWNTFTKHYCEFTSFEPVLRREF